MEEIKRIGLQFFAGEGATGGEGGAGGDGNSPGVEAAAPGQEQDNLEKLGIPKEAVEKYGAKMRRRNAPAAEEKPPEQTEDQTQTPAAEANPEEKPARKTLAELAKQDPELNRELQNMMSERVRGFAQARDQLKELQPALAIIARQYGMDASDLTKLDAKTLVEHVTKDDRYWEELAGEYGVTPDVARKIKGYEQLKAEQERREQDALQEQQFNAHMAKLTQQAAQLRETFRDFDLFKELRNDKFRMFVSPQIGMSVKDAFYAVHAEEIRQAENTLIAQKVKEAMANNIAAGQNRPREGGSSQSASTGGLRRTKWTKAEIEEARRRGDEAYARGEKYYIR